MYVANSNVANLTSSETGVKHHEAGAKYMIRYVIIHSHTSENTL